MATDFDSRGHGRTPSRGVFARFAGEKDWSAYLLEQAKPPPTWNAGGAVSMWL